MSDQTNKMNNKNDTAGTNESCFGGFSNRLSYESYSVSRRIGVLSILGGVFICLALGIFLTMCGLLVYRLIDSNKELYYPKSEVSDASVPEAAAVLDMGEVPVETSVSENHLTSINSEMASRYLIPEGVMVKNSELLSSYLGTEILDGDIIVSFGGNVINDAEELYSQLTQAECCETKQVVLFRNNEYIVLDATVGK